MGEADADLELPGDPLGRFVLGAAPRLGTRPALIDARSGRTLTYGELAARVEAVAGGLGRRGLGKGDVLALYLPNLPEFVVALLAAATLGAVTTTVHPLYTARELAVQLDDSAAAMLVTIPSLVANAARACPGTRVREVFVVGEAAGATPFAALAAGAPLDRTADIDPDRDLAVLPYSSGTTGLPKGVMLSHANLVANIGQFTAVEPPPEDGIALAVLPFFHIYGMVIALLAYLHRGISLVTLPCFDLEDFLRAIERFGIARVHVVPPIVLALAKDPRVADFDLSTLDYLGVGAAPISGALVRACADRIGCRIQQGYGLTEASPLTHLNPAADDRTRAGSVGPPVPRTQAQIVGLETGRELPPGADGELRVRGPQVMRGYLNRPAATAATRSTDGWLATGDVGHVDDDGYLYLVDRAKELIKCKGYQVAPAELEGLLVAHPQVRDAAVVPLADAAAGEVPKAFVVRDGDVTERELADWVADRVAPFKRLRAVEFIDAVPRSASGKILRRKLRG